MFRFTQCAYTWLHVISPESLCCSTAFLCEPRFYPSEKCYTSTRIALYSVLIIVHFVVKIQILMTISLCGTFMVFLVVYKETRWFWEMSSSFSFISMFSLSFYFIDLFSYFLSAAPLHNFFQNVLPYIILNL